MDDTERPEDSIGDWQRAKRKHDEALSRLRALNARTWTEFTQAKQGGRLAHFVEEDLPFLRQRTGEVINDVIRAAAEEDAAAQRISKRLDQVKAGDVRLNPGTTKNREGRVFPLTDDLRALLEERRRVTKDLERRHGQIIPWVFFRMVATGRIPHDLRRTAVRNMVRRGVPERVAMQLTDTFACERKRNVTKC